MVNSSKIPSYDIIGDIAVFSKLDKKQNLTAKNLLRLNPNIKTVLLKIKQFSGKYRLPKFKVLAGKKTKETLYKENNARFKVDLEKCYFSPRLGNERLRISDRVKHNETILVMFSGIAIYPIVISRNSKAREIYSVEINPTAHKYAIENLMLNKIVNIKLFKGDVKKILPKIKKNTIIHFYDFSQEKDFPNQSINKIKKYFRKIKVINAVKCGAYAPYIYRVCIDFQIL